MENTNQIIYGLVSDTKNMEEQNNIINYLDGKKPKEFITVSDIKKISNQCTKIIVQYERPTITV